MGKKDRSRWAHPSTLADELPHSLVAQLMHPRPMAGWGEPNKQRQSKQGFRKGQQVWLSMKYEEVDSEERERKVGAGVAGEDQIFELAHARLESICYSL